MGSRQAFGMNSAQISSDQNTVLCKVTIGLKGFMNKVVLSGLKMTTAQGKENSTLGILLVLAGKRKFE